MPGIRVTILGEIKNNIGVLIAMDASWCGADIHSRCLQHKTHEKYTCAGDTVNIVCTHTSVRCPGRNSAHMEFGSSI